MSTLKIEKILDDTASLLARNNEKSWEKILISLNNELKSSRSNKVDTVIKILNLFGGMGTLNDIVLYSKNQPAIKENNLLENLKKQLYQECKDYRLKH